MSLSPQLVEKLCCPDCHGKLDYREADLRLDCQACKLSFKVTDDIPVLLVDEADRFE